MAPLLQGRLPLHHFYEGSPVTVDDKLNPRLHIIFFAVQENVSPFAATLSTTDSQRRAKFHRTHHIPTLEADVFGDPATYVSFHLRCKPRGLEFLSHFDALSSVTLV